MGELVDSPLEDSRQAATESTASISGIVFEDIDRDGVPDEGEPPWEGKGIWVLTEDGSTFLTSAVTDAAGRYTISGLASGTYLVRYHPTSWSDVKDDWVPTTTANLWPEKIVTVGGDASFDLGWRPITTSSDWSAPITTLEAPSGLVVKSYTDAITAETVYAALISGTLRGDEEALTTVLFGYPEANSSCKHSVSGAAGSYSNYRATIHVDFSDWVRSRHSDLFHEYGHAWSRYYQKIVNQWDNLDVFLQVRGIDPSDPRLGSTHDWIPGEIIADDFRTLFGSQNAGSHSNKDIPPANEVPGLAEWLTGEFMTGGGAPPEPSNLAPSADFSFSCTDLACTFDGSGSSDSDGSIVSYVWQFEDGSTASGAVVEHTFAASGDYQVELTVTDDDGASHTATEFVLVSSSDGGSGGGTADGPIISDTTTGSLNAGSSWQGWVTVTVTDGAAPASGVLVEADWASDGRHGASGTASCTTDANGQCSLSTTQAKKVAAVTFYFTAPSIAMVTVAKP